MRMFTAQDDEPQRRKLMWSGVRVSDVSPEVLLAPRCCIKLTASDPPLLRQQSREHLRDRIGDSKMSFAPKIKWSAA